MTTPDRPAVTDEEIGEASFFVWKLIKASLRSGTPSYPGRGEEIAEFQFREGFGEGARFALAACASQSKSRLARYDEAVRLLRECVSVLGDAATTKESDWLEEMHGTICALGEASEAFLAAEPKAEERFPLEEVAPEEAQRRYLKSMKTEERNG